MRDLKKLERDWKEHPCLNYLGFTSVEALAKHLENAHNRLTSPQGGPYGYLYQQQLERIKKLKERIHAD